MANLLQSIVLLIHYQERFFQKQGSYIFDSEEVSGQALKMNHFAFQQ